MLLTVLFLMVIVLSVLRYTDSDYPFRIFNLHTPLNDIVYQHCNQPNHLILSIRVRIIEKIYHRTTNPNLATPLRRQKED